MPSRDWDYFMRNFFGDPYMMWHDGIDPTSAARLQGEEREKGEQLLIESMMEGSHYAVMGLKEMRSERSVPLMEQLLENAHGNLMIELAIALNTLKGTLDYLPQIIHVLTKHGSPYIRLVAAMKLRQYDTPEVVRSLFNAVSDPDYLVRNHASESLLYIHGLPSSISEHKEIFQLIIKEFDPKDDESIKEAMEYYAKATEMLREFIAENA